MSEKNNNNNETAYLEKNGSHIGPGTDPRADSHIDSPGGVVPGSVLRVIDTGACRGGYNMAVDEMLALKVQQGKSPPVLRFFRWEPACLSLGCFQKVAREVDLDGLRSRGVDLVRRPSGGRAVLHDHEMTYSVILPDFGKGVIDSYRIISQGLLAGLKILGLDASLQKPAPVEREHASAACFDSPSSYELLCGGKKLIGSAQRRLDGVILQHGSIPFTLDAEKLYDCLLVDADETKRAAKRTRLAALFNKKATSLFAEIGGQVSYDTVRQAFVQGFGRELAKDTIWSELTPEEDREAQNLADSKYYAPWWQEKF